MDKTTGSHVQNLGWLLRDGSIPNAGTNCATLRKIYDEVTVDDIREAWDEAKQVANSH